MSTDLVRAPIVIPPALAKVGVEVQEQDGMRVVHIPAALQRTYNVVQPISEISQADPDFTPSVGLLTLDLERHTYTREGKQDLSKDGIGLIAFMAGIEIDSDPVPPPMPGMIAYKAFARIRRSDGSMQSWVGNHEITLADEYEIVAQQVRAKAAKAAGEGQPWTADAIEQAIKTRWLKEKKSLPQKCATGAQLRAITAVLQLKRGGYTKADLAKPFIVVKYNSTPSDPEVRRLRALQAGDALAGRRSLPAPTVEPTQYDEQEQHEAQYGEAMVPSPDVVDHVPAAAQPAQQDDAAGEPPLPPAPVGGEVPADVAAAGDTLIGFGEAGRRGLKISELSDEHLTWLAVEYEPTGATAAERQLVINAGRKYRNWKLAQS